MEELYGHREEPRQTEFIFSTWGMPPLNEEQIETIFPEMKAVFYAVGSVQHFVKPFLQKGVRVFGARAANAIPVAEYAACGDGIIWIYL